MDKFNNFAYYMLVVILIGAAAFFFHSRYMAVATVMLVLLPLVLRIYMHIAAHCIKISLEDNPAYIKRGEKTALVITVINKGPVPVVNLSFDLSLANAFTEKEQIRSINAAAPAFGRRKITVSMEGVLCGRINVKVSRLKIKDMLSVAEYKSKAESGFTMDVMPNTTEISGEKAKSGGVADDSEREHKDSAGTEVIDIREYVRGDSLKAIHWKLSAKKDELFVREKGDNINDEAVLLFELNKGAIDNILDTVYTTAKYYVGENLPIKIYWAGSGEEQLSDMRISTQKDITLLFGRIYSSIATSERTHTLNVAKRQLSGGRALYVSAEKDGLTVIDL